MSDSSKGMDRRAFFAGSGVLAAGALVAATGLAGCGKSGDADKDLAATGGDWDDTADIVVIGGATGLAGAIAAAKGGADTLVIEKMPNFGGNASLNGGVYFTGGTKAQQAFGAEDSLDQCFDDCMATCQGMPSANLLRSVIESSTAVIDDMVDDGLEFHIWTGHEEWPVRCHQVIQDGEPIATGQWWIDYFARKYEEAGGRTMMKTRARHLIMGDDGRVIGVEVTDEDGATKRIGAKAVLMATGGYASSHELVSRWHPEARSWTPIGGKHSTGDGHKMLMEVDGAMCHIEETSSLVGAQPGTRGISSVENEYGVGFFEKPRSTFIVNDQGERFEDETVGYTANAELGRVMTSPYFLIWDQTEHDTDDYTVMFGWSKEEVANAVEQGDFIKGDTVEELAAALFVDPVNLQKSIDDFNAGANGGTDPYGRPAEKSRALEPPYWGCRMTKAVDGTTLGSVQVNDDGVVEDEMGEPILGVYGAGNDLPHASYTANKYISSGQGFGFGCGMSRYCAEKALEYIQTL